MTCGIVAALEAEDQIVELKFSRHGPVFFEDKARHLAYAERRTAGLQSERGHRRGRPSTDAET